MTIAQTSRTLPTPEALRADLPLSPAAAEAIGAGRAEIARALRQRDSRLIVIVGPCSLHDPVAALEYAAWLSEMARRVDDRLRLVMRAYVEKPRTRLGWRGMVADPWLDGTGAIADGLRVARALLVQIAERGVGLATEFVEPMTPSYLADLVTWAAVGARTVESPAHRQMAADLPCPVGFKNTIWGDVGAAANAIVAARTPQTIWAWNEGGAPVERRSPGNPATHVVLRGGRMPNHSAPAVRAAVERLRAEGLEERVMVDCSHANSRGEARRQLEVVDDIAEQVDHGSSRIFGVMLESHLRGGSQPLGGGRALVYGQSVTDACLDLDETATALVTLHAACGGRSNHPPSVRG